MFCKFCHSETPNPKFCSASCSARFNNRNRSPRSFQSRLKTATSCAKGNPIKKCKTCNAEFYAFESKLSKYCSQKCNGKQNKDIFNANFCLNGKGNHKRVLIHERGYRCEGCTLEIWRGKPISLQLEHKDGNHYNNIKENLELLCPNCHSQTPTYNRKKTAAIITDDELLTSIQATKNIYQTLRKFGLNCSSANYSRANRLLSINTNGPVA